MLTYILGMPEGGNVRTFTNFLADEHSMFGQGSALPDSPPRAAVTESTRQPDKSEMEVEEGEGGGSRCDVNV